MAPDTEPTDETLDIQLAASAKQAEDQFYQTFGLMRGAWDSDALKSHLGEPLRATIPIASPGRFP